MTTETIKTRSNKAAMDIVAERGLTEGQFTITKIATAKYELVITIADEKTSDDMTLTLYVAGIKLRRIGGDENEEEIEDPEAFAETYLSRKYLKKNGGWVWGRTTQGHNWHTKRQKALRARIAEAEAAGEDVTALVAELARISGKGAMGKFTWGPEDVLWLSPIGDLDDFGNAIHDRFVDGATRMGPWAIMTPECHAAHGRGLGLGLGQLYTRQSDGRWLKTEG